MPENNSVRSQIEKIRELENAGSEVLILNADVANAQEMERAFLTASKSRNIDGIFHLAGVPGSGLVQFKNADSSARVFQPKVFGTEVLAAMIRRFPVDFMVMFSSITSVTGGIGQVDYCAASRFLDAVAQSGDPAKKTRFISIAWDAWQSDTWQDPALSAFPKLRDLLKMRRKQFGITSTEGMAVLRRVLASSLLLHIIIYYSTFPILQLRIMISIPAHVVSEGSPGRNGRLAVRAQTQAHGLVTWRRATHWKSR